MTLQINENKLALVWLSNELLKFEKDKAHARIMIEIVDGKAQRRESTEKGLFQVK